MRKRIKHLGIKTPRSADATGARRRLQALAVIGWSPHQIAEVAGSHFRTLYNIQSGRQLRASPSTLEGVERAFETLCMTMPPLNQGQARAVVMAHAQKMGWVGPLHYDNIDDPAEEPRPSYARLRSQHRSVYAEDVEWLAAAGETLESIAHRLGVKAEAVDRALRRQGHTELLGRIPRVAKVAA